MRGYCSVRLIGFVFGGGVSVVWSIMVFPTVFVPSDTVYVTVSVRAATFPLCASSNTVEPVVAWSRVNLFSGIGVRAVTGTPAPPAILKINAKLLSVVSGLSSASNVMVRPLMAVSGANT